MVNKFDIRSPVEETIQIQLLKGAAGSGEVYFQQPCGDERFPDIQSIDLKG
jgi:hypothetical protein